MSKALFCNDIPGKTAKKRPIEPNFQPKFDEIDLFNN